MVRIIKWLGRNKILAVLLGIAVYFSIVAFHEVITELAIRLRNAIGRDRYNEYLAYGFLALLLIVIFILFYHSFRSRHSLLNSFLVFSVTVLMVISFRLLMVYSIEAIHFVEYMIVVVLLLPVLRSYGETVFWVTILGMLDELFQYIFLTPNFEYFDFNDIILNLIGAGAGAIVVFVFCSNTFYIRQIKWHKSPALITGLGLLAIFLILLVSGKITINPLNMAGSENWFSLNREALPDEFWKEAYPGRVFHILRPFEGIILMYMLFIGFIGLDVFVRKSEEKSLI